MTSVAAGDSVTYRSAFPSFLEGVSVSARVTWLSGLLDDYGAFAHGCRYRHDTSFVRSTPGSASKASRTTPSHQSSADS